MRSKGICNGAAHVVFVLEIFVGEFAAVDALTWVRGRGRLGGLLLAVDGSLK